MKLPAIMAATFLWGWWMYRLGKRDERDRIADAYPLLADQIRASPIRPPGRDPR